MKLYTVRAMVEIVAKAEDFDSAEDIIRDLIYVSGTTFRVTDIMELTDVSKLPFEWEPNAYPFSKGYDYKNECTIKQFFGKK